MIVGVTGYARHGKDTVAGILGEFGFVRHGFADALRSMAAAVDPMIALSGAPDDIRKAVPGDMSPYTNLLTLLGYDKAKEIPDFRRFLQNLGTEGVRGHIGDSAWVDALALTLRKEGALLPYGPGDVSVVIPDVRFPNEAQAIRDWGGVLWKVTRLTESGGDFDNGTSKSHPSESQIASLEYDLEFIAASVDELRQLVIEDGLESLED